MESQDIIKIFHAKIKPEIDHVIGVANLDTSKLKEVVYNLPSTIKLLRNSYTLNAQNKETILDYLLNLYGLNETQHIYIRGMGIYNGQEQHELEKDSWFYYAKHRSYLLEKVYSENPEIVYGLDEETDQIIKRIPKPEITSEEYAIKGMVIGHVQSGKTANFTHLISKAASLGYKFIIVLSGMTNTLRVQTQNRLNKELIGDTTGVVDTKNLVEWLPGEPKYRSLTTLEREYSNDDGDFKIPVSDLKSQFQNDDVTIAVIKKLAILSTSRKSKKQHFKSIIGNLINWIEEDNSLKFNERPPILIIDDEADQASVDASKIDADPTTINHAIRKLISLFPRSVYIGYTATPFANIFINKDDEYLGLKDLYPKDFIYALSEPKQYFGNSKFFSLFNEGTSLIKVVKDNERNIINNEKKPTVTSDLKNAILDFIFAILIKNHRKDNKTKSMLIHTDFRNAIQNIVYSKVVGFLDNLHNDDLNVIFEKFEKYIEESKIIARKLGVPSIYPKYTADIFNEKIIEVINEIKSSNIKIVNGENKSLNYEKIHSNIICIGGNLLSRGVTVEGLCVSYYLRDTTKYDTLLQMARWFGYRSGYEDLLRIYTTLSIKNNFEYLINVENDLRNEIQRYIDEGVTPEEFSPKVRAHTKMVPTLKMGVAQETKSYAQHVVQTIYFHKSYDKLFENYIYTKKLIENNLHMVSPALPLVLENLNLELLYKFITSFNYFEKNSFDIESILNYIKDRENKSEIADFDILIASLKKPKYAISEQIKNLIINPASRNLRGSKNKLNKQFSEINLGVISDTNDISFASNRNRLTLIIYFIDHKNSNSFNSTYENLTDKEIDFNPVGYALVFPKTKYAIDSNNYFQQIFS